MASFLRARKSIKLLVFKPLCSCHLILWPINSMTTVHFSLSQQVMKQMQFWSLLTSPLWGPAQGSFKSCIFWVIPPSSGHEDSLFWWSTRSQLQTELLTKHPQGVLIPMTPVLHFIPSPDFTASCCNLSVYTVWVLFGLSIKMLGPEAYIFPRLQPC